MTSEVSSILAVLRTIVPRPGSEAQLAADVLAALRRANIDAANESTLATGRVDLRLGSVAIELKIKGTAEKVLSQLERYASDPAISTVILVTSSAKHRAMPDTVRGLPLHDVYDIWRDRLAHHKPVFYTGKEDSKAKDAAAQAFIRGESKLLIMSLRSGQGLDGLQGVCHRVVQGELDWSPQVHQQLTGRAHRDGQAEPTMEYWPISEIGSDPVIMDTLGVKRWQSDAVVDPKGERLLEVQADPDAIRRLAEEYLRRRGLDPSKLPEDR